MSERLPPNDAPMKDGSYYAQDASAWPGWSLQGSTLMLPSPHYAGGSHNQTSESDPVYSAPPAHNPLYAASMLPAGPGENRTASLTSYSSRLSSVTSQRYCPYPEAQVADPKKLRSYSKNDQKVLELARKLFTATACSLGQFFMQKNAPRTEFDMHASEALAQARFDLGYYDSCTLAADRDVLFIQTALTELRSKIKQDARLIIKQEYGLNNIPEHLQALYNSKQITLAEITQRRVEMLISESGDLESNLQFTDGPLDQQGNPGRLNHSAALQILTHFFFTKENGLGRKYPAKFGPPLKPSLIAFAHTLSWMCLLEWETGGFLRKHVSVVKVEEKYRAILAAITDAQIDPYGGPEFEEMCMSWTVVEICDLLYTSETSGIEVQVGGRGTIHNTYGPASLPLDLHAGVEGSSSQGPSNAHFSTAIAEWPWADNLEMEGVDASGGAWFF